MREFRATWKDNSLSAYKKGERLRSFFRFCADAKYIDENPVNRMRPPKVQPTKIKTFSAEELEKIIWASELFPLNGIYGEGNRTRIKAFVLVLRYTGLRKRKCQMSADIFSGVAMGSQNPRSPIGREVCGNFFHWPALKATRTCSGIRSQQSC